MRTPWQTAYEVKRRKMEHCWRLRMRGSSKGHQLERWRGRGRNQRLKRMNYDTKTRRHVRRSRGQAHKSDQAPLDCKETLCEGDGWRSIIMTRNDYYTAALNKTRGLHMWCEERWGEEHMSYSEILEYKNESLTQQHRLIY